MISECEFSTFITSSNVEKNNSLWQKLYVHFKGEQMASTRISSILVLSSFLSLLHLPLIVVVFRLKWFDYFTTLR